MKLHFSKVSPVVRDRAEIRIPTPGLGSEEFTSVPGFTACWLHELDFGQSSLWPHPSCLVCTCLCVIFSPRDVLAVSALA